MSPAGPLSVTMRFAESTASTEAVICATRSATPLPGAVAVIVAPPAAGSRDCASSADGARLAAAIINVQTLLRIGISMSGVGLPHSRKSLPHEVCAIRTPACLAEACAESAARDIPQIGGSRSRRTGARNHGRAVDTADGRAYRIQNHAMSGAGIL